MYNVFTCIKTVFLSLCKLFSYSIALLTMALTLSQNSYEHAHRNRTCRKWSKCNEINMAPSTRRFSLHPIHMYICGAFFTCIRFLGQCLNIYIWCKLTWVWQLTLHKLSKNANICICSRGVQSKNIIKNDTVYLDDNKNTALFDCLENDELSNIPPSFLRIKLISQPLFPPPP